MSLNGANELLAAMHKDTKDEMSTSSILLNSLHFKQSQERKELQELYIKSEIFFKSIIILFKGQGQLQK